MMCDVPYKIYSKKSILQKAIKYRTEKTGRRENIPAAIALFFSFGYLSFSVLYKPSYFTGYDHLEFLALSQGFDSFTETGYKSVFVPSLENEIYSFQEIKDSVVGMLKKESGIDLLAEVQVPIQLALF